MLLRLLNWLRSFIQDFAVTPSIFWYDYETTGINPRCDRPLQVAGIRTDEALNEIGAPLNLYCQPSDDILPHPMACLITGITPQRLAEQGLPEAEFMTRLHAEMSVPGTCGAGYNSLRFDDEVTRYSLYRNFFDPYGREWQGGNTRWDLIDLLRTMIEPARIAQTHRVGSGEQAEACIRPNDAILIEQGQLAFGFQHALDDEHHVRATRIIFVKHKGHRVLERPG